VLKCAEQSCGMAWCVASDQRTVRWEDRYRLALADIGLVVLSSGSAAVPAASVGRFGPLRRGSKPVCPACSRSATSDIAV
jgi:hypothetical protein